MLTNLSINLVSGRLVNEGIMKGKRYNNELTSANVMGSAGNHLYLSELTAILNR